MSPLAQLSVALLATLSSVGAFAPTATSVSSKVSYLSASASSNNEDISRRSALVTLAGLTVSPLIFPALPASARLEGVNKPELLPSEQGLNVIQVEKFLTKGQEKRMNDLLTKLEADTGYKVRVLCQAYPRTPGLAIRDYWSLGREGDDDKYIVLVVDEFGGKGNVLNFNVGDGMKFALPNVFWTRLSSKYGTTFFVKENGIDLAITNAIEAIVSCLRSEDQYCVNVPDQGMSMRSLGM
mmetsp:Transcript_8123/g.11700  ORF Transcript_8123/g.11700 Transcript_8123/m.11700 type:complete len:239 (-) Transcript_8123:8-724(-)